jgi:DNA-binding transcriptional LysR family regulator
MNIELRLLKSFQAVADHLNFRRAAEELHLTQPALSRQISQLENAIGKRLFHRDKRNVELTHAGKFLYNRIGKLFSDVDTLIKETREAAEGERGTLSLGYTESAMASFLPSLLRNLREKLPHIQLQLKQEHSEHLSREVALHRLDVAIISLLGDTHGLRRTPIAQEAMGIVLPDNHPLVNKKEISLSALKKEKFILFLYQDNPSLYSDIMTSCQKAGFAPQVIEEAPSRILAVNMVAAGLGVTFLSENLSYYCNKGALFKPLKNPRPSMQYHLIEPEKGNNPCVKELKKIVKLL